MQTAQQADEDLLAKLRIKVPDNIACEPVLAYLRSKAADSPKTAETYCDALSALQRFFDRRYPGLGPARSLSILLACQRGRIDSEYSLLPWADIYKIMDQYVGGLVAKGHKASVSRTWAAGVKGFYAYNDVDIIDSKYRQRVKIPKDRKEEEYPLSRDEIRQMLITMTNLRLKAFCTAEASIGPRPVEHAAVRYRDCNFEVDGIVVVAMRAEYSKNKLPRTVYWSQEAKELAWRLKVDKYDYNKPDPDALVFSYKDDATPHGVYGGVSEAFRDHLSAIGMNRTVPALSTKYEINLMSFRHYAETTIEDHTSANYADYLLGHKKSTYYGHKEDERRQIYWDKCAAHLVFFDYHAVERRAREAEAKVEKTTHLLEQNALWQQQFVGAMATIKELSQKVKDMEEREARRPRMAE